MGTFAGLNTALSGLQAHQRSTDLIGHNIANVNTPGYTRRSVLLEPSVGITVANRYTTSFTWNNLGVNVAAVNRARDGYLDAKARTELANSASASRLDSILSGIESAFPEPADNAIAGQLAAFWNTFDDAANNPASLPARVAVLSQSANLVQSIAKAGVDLTRMHEDLSTQLELGIGEINALAQQVAELNGQIRAASGGGADLGDLQDQRDLLIDQLTTAVGVTTRENEYQQVDVLLGGVALVNGDRAEELTFKVAGDLAPPLDALNVQQTELQWKRGGYPVLAFGGNVGATIQGLNDVVPRYMADLDTITASLVSTVNSVHSTGQGQNGATDVNLNFFDPAGVTASTLAISSDVAGQPSRIALGALGSGALDGTVGRTLAALATSSSGPDGLHRTMIGKLGVEAQTASRRATLQQRFAIETENQRTAASGVNLDEEMTNLVMSQRAYEASARLLTTVDDMLDQLINRTGLVGR